MTNNHMLSSTLRVTRRRSTKALNEIFRPFSARRSQSIAGVRVSPRIRGPMPANTSLSHTIDISVAIHDFSTSETANQVTCELYENDTESEEKWKKVGVGAPVRFSRNIEFPTKFAYQFTFERTQLIKVNICRCHDHDMASCSDDVMATSIFKVDELIGSFGLQLRRSLMRTTTIASTLSTSSRHSSEYLGGLIISAEMPEKEQPIVVQFHGKSIDRKDFLWDETAVFFRVFRLEEGKDDDSLVFLYESEAIKNHSHPQWAEFRLDTQDAADNRNRLLEIWVMYRDVDGTEGYIGKFLTTYAKMKYGPGPDNVYNVINDVKKAQKKSYEHSGKMELVKFTDVSFYSFLDYVVSGTQLHFEIAVDFSSAEPVHELDQRRFDGELHMAVRAIGGIIRDYTPNRLFPAFGIGAKIPPTFHESNEFFLNFSLDPICRGLDGVMDSYKKAQTLVTPTKESKLAPVINYVTRMSHRSGFRGLHYHVLAIFTRGSVSDLKDIQQAVNAASEAPLSVIIIGMGEGDFSSLQKISSRKKDANGKRECVEFFQMKTLLNGAETPAQNKSRIAERALRNVPNHLVHFMHNANIAAKPPIQVCRSPLFHSSSLIPDKPTQFSFEPDFPNKENPIPALMLSPDLSPRPRPDRRGSDSQYLDVETIRGALTVRIPERAHSVLQTSREQYQRRLKERGLARMKFPRVELSTLESSGGSTQDSSV
ncbi:unnamed protein product [Caenorhabditis auriculariae]|uniref:Copine C-terminal domain-containing protein n=1 Tax=Caenorhabditis auriculariae TaxID=2777116 RepID=A0A8S1HZH5_9PELO|nr:unnamed protein product [Caenorhabditis auriculariae]